MYIHFKKITFVNIYINFDIEFAWLRDHTFGLGVCVVSHSVCPWSLLVLIGFCRISGKNLFYSDLIHWMYYFISKCGTVLH